MDQVTYRSGSVQGAPPDVTVIQKQMAIVAWQPGPNRALSVPTEARPPHSLLPPLPLLPPPRRLDRL